MKHLQTFESIGKSVEISIVNFNYDGGDEVFALYIDGKLHKYGDYYHDKIGSWIEGFIKGVLFTGVEVNETRHTVGDTQIAKGVTENGYSPPTNLSDIAEMSKLAPKL